MTNLSDYKICPDVVFTIDGEGFLASNYRSRTHVWLNMSLFKALANWEYDGSFVLVDKTRFSNVDGLLEDPTCLDVTKTMAKQEALDLPQALDILAKKFIVIKDEIDYNAYFNKKTSILDNKHFGTFHQQLGRELRLRLRIDADEWWYQQKFDPQTGQVRENLYKYIQEEFLDNYFKSLLLKDKIVLDFGCGSGMAARRFIEKGAQVIGIDPDKILLQKAVKSIGGKFQPILMDLAAKDPLVNLPKSPVDLVWMADVFMFYFYPHNGGNPIMPPTELLLRLTSNLKSGGKCIIMQPHGVFWLAPWLGNEKQPYTILTEYADKIYSVAPGLEELAKVFHDAGLLIKRIFEPKPENLPKIADKKAAVFAKNFPQWWVFECIKI